MFNDFSSSKSWDHALGTVFGFRWFSIAEVPNRQLEPDLYVPVDRHTSETTEIVLRGVKAEWSSKTFDAGCVISTFQGGALEVRYSTAHESPDPDCTCGLYAYWDATLSPPVKSPAIPGVVQASGRTLLGTRGFRTQRAQIVGLALPDLPHYKRELILPRLQARYEVPIYESFEELLEHHPLTEDYKSQAPELEDRTGPAFDTFAINKCAILEGAAPSVAELGDEYKIDSGTIAADVGSNGSWFWINAAILTVASLTGDKSQSTQL